MLKKSYNFFSFSCFIAILVFFVLPTTTRSASTSSESVYLDVVPKNPAPGESVTVTLSSYSIKLDSVLISWSTNGKNISSGVGKKTFYLNAPATGQETKVQASFALPDGIIKKTIVVRPGTVTLLWQANDSYVPPFYRGKALPSPNSQIKIVAIPEVKIGFQSINSKNMIYSWKKDYANNVDGSGYAKDSFVYTSDYLDNSSNIAVKVSSLDQKYSYETNINVPTFSPKVIFYKNDSVLGTLWEKALTNEHKIVENEIIEASPYFISPKNISNPFLSWNWSINDQPITTTDFPKNLLPIKTEVGTSGTSKIGLEIYNTIKIVEDVKKEIFVNF